MPGLVGDERVVGGINAARAQRMADVFEAERLQQQEDLRRRGGQYGIAEEFEIVAPPLPNPYKKRKPPTDQLKVTLKKRHLKKNERDAYHQPEDDWCESKKGDVCRSSFTLDLDDILEKHNVE